MDYKITELMACVIARELKNNDKVAIGLYGEFMLAAAFLSQKFYAPKLKKAKYHYDRAVKISDGLNPGPYMAWATTVCVNEGDYKEFERLLTIVIELDLEKTPENKLNNILAQEKAVWLLEHLDDYFLIGD